MPKPQIPKSERIITGVLVIVLIPVIASVVTPKSTSSDQRDTPQAAYNLPPGWHLTEPWQTLPEDRMYEKINGRAVLFQEHGAVKLDTASVTIKDASFDIFIYTMKSPDAALGVFLDETNEQADPLTLGDRANRTAGLIRAVKGAQYLVVMSLQQTDTSQLATTLASALVQQFQSQGVAQASLLQKLPKTNQLPASATANPDSAFGLESLKDSFSANYRINDLEFALLLKKTTAQTLKNVADELREFGATKIQLRDNQLNAEFFDQQISLVVKDIILYGIYGTMTTRQTEQCIQWAIQHTGKDNGQ